MHPKEATNRSRRSQTGSFAGLTWSSMEWGTRGNESYYVQRLHCDGCATRRWVRGTRAIEHRSKVALFSTRLRGVCGNAVRISNLVTMSSTLPCFRFAAINSPQRCTCCTGACVREN